MRRNFKAIITIVFLIGLLGFVGCGIRVTWEPSSDRSFPGYYSSVDQGMLNDALSETIQGIKSQDFPQGAVALVKAVDTDLHEIVLDQIYVVLKTEKDLKVFKVKEKDIRKYASYVGSFLIAYPVVYGIAQKGVLPKEGEKFGKDLIGERIARVMLYARLMDPRMKILWEKEFASQKESLAYYKIPQPRTVTPEGSSVTIK